MNTNRCCRIADQLNETVFFLVQPSHTESLPNTVLEGMAARLTVIATQTGGTGELIESHVNGVLVETESPESLAQAVVALAHNSQVRKRNHETARQDRTAQPLVMTRQ